MTYINQIYHLNNYGYAYDKSEMWIGSPTCHFTARWRDDARPAGRDWRSVVSWKNTGSWLYHRCLSWLRREEAESGVAPGEKHLRRGPPSIPAMRARMRARQELRVKRNTRRNISSVQPGRGLRLYKICLNFPIIKLLQKEHIGDRDLSNCLWVSKMLSHRYKQQQKDALKPFWD